ncbi:MAG TPA: Rieske (2Fe-2S) protein [Sporichthyaceae bacterium]|jgi:Rieske Fe-S protein
MSTQRYVRDLLRGRKPKGFQADAEAAAELRAAITLAAAQPDADTPREEFVHDLHRRLAEQVGASTETPEGPAKVGTVVPLRLGPTRRRVLVAGGIAAGAAAIGAVGDHLISSDGPPQDAEAAGTLEPTVGTWRLVANSTDLDVGGVRHFDAGSVVGFVSRDAAGLRAVSGICTHQGCRLNLDADGRQLDCPCHNASFAIDGTPVRHQLPKAPRPLPHLQVRDRDGQIEVYVPTV